MQKNFTSQILSFDVKCVENMFSGTVILGAGPLFSDLVVLACSQRKDRGTKSVVTRLIRKIRRRFLHRSGGFRGRPIQRCHRDLRYTNPCCHGDESLEFLT